MSLNRSKRLVTGLVASATLLLTGCGGGVGPGVAAEIGDEAIPTSEVDDLATIICEIDKASQRAGSPRSAQRATALSVLLQIEVGRRVGDLDEVPQRAVNQQLAAAAEARRAVPDDLQPVFDDVVRDSTRAGLAMEAVAVRNLREAGEQPDPNTVQAEIARLQQEYVADNPVEVDPRFGTYREGQVVAGDGSLSVAVSDRALSFVPSSTDDPAAAPAADLPASQVCG